MRDFQLITARVSDSDGAEGTGYTFTVGRNGGAIANIAAKEITEIVLGKDADCIEALWNLLWWGMHYGGRGGPTVLAQSAFDMALWDLKAKKLGQPLWLLLGGFSNHVPCYAGGIDLELPLPQLIKQTERDLDKGFRAIKMKVGRKRLSEDVERLAACPITSAATFRSWSTPICDGQPMKPYVPRAHLRPMTLCGSKNRSHQTISPGTRVSFEKAAFPLRLEKTYARYGSPAISLPEEA